MKALLFYIVLMGWAFSGKSQEIFQRTYGSLGDEMGRAVINVSSGGYAIAGTANSYSDNSTDVYFLRLDETGDYIWGRHFGGDGIDWGTDLIESEDGNFYVCGYSNSYGNGGYDILLLKISNEGQLIWQKTFGGADWDFGAKIMEHNSFLYICGSTTSSSERGTILKLDLEGELLWQKELQGSGSVEFSAIAVNENNELICIGTASANILDQKNIIVAVYNSDGELIRSFPLEQFDNATATDAVYTSNNRLAVSAVRNGDTEFGDQDQLLLMVNTETGELLWSINLGTAEFDSANAVAITSSNDLALAGSVYHYTPVDHNVFGHIFRIGMDGSYLAGGELNVLVGNVDGHSEFFDIVQTPDGGYICVGQSSAFGYNNQVYVVKLNAENTIDSTNENYVDLATTAEIKKAPSVLNIYPNPTSESVQITTSQSNLISYHLISSKGQLVKSGFLSDSQEINLKDVAADVYILELTDTTGHSQRVKLVVN